MAKIVHLADSHFNESSRFDECIEMHNHIVEYVRHNSVSAVVHAGDVYDRASTPRERLAAADFFVNCAVRCPTIIIRGNHDRAQDLELLDQLHTNILIQEVPELISLYDADIACLPWPRKAELLASNANSDEASALLKCVLRGLAAKRTGQPSLLVAHAMVRGSITSTGQPLVGHDMELGLEDLVLAGCNGVALGHIHCQQSWHYDERPIVYSGSPRRTAFGEHEEKGFIVWDITEDGANWDFVNLPATPMLDIEATFLMSDVNPGSFRMSSQQTQPSNGAEIRFRYHVASEHREIAKRLANEMKDDWLQDGAASVKLDPIVTVAARARMPELNKAHTLDEQLSVYWEDRNTDRTSQLLNKLHQLESEIQ